MLKRDQRKLDLSCLQYLTEEDLNDKYTSLDRIRKEFPHTKKSKLELFSPLILLYSFQCYQNKREKDLSVYFEQAVPL